MSVDRCARAVNFYASLSSAAKRRPPPSSLLHSCIVRSTASNRISSNSPGQNQLYSHRQRRSYSGFTASINSEQDGYRRVALDQSEEARYESLSTAEIYEALRQHARLGEHSLVHNAIDCLVRRRGERPNLRLYSALILAELHPQSGSSYGLERLLNEMKEDGIAIDSGICHDVLKVLAVHPDFQLRSDVIALMSQNHYAQTVESRYDIATGQFREGSLESGLQTIEALETEGHNVPAWLYDIAIYALINFEDVDGALELTMSKCATHVDNSSPALSLAFLDVASDQRHLQATKWLWNGKVLTGDVTIPLGTCLSVLATAAEHGDPELATEACRKFASLGQALGALEYEHLCQSYLSSRRPNLAGALSTVSLMLSNDIQPLVSLTSLFSEFFQNHQGTVEETITILRKLHERGRRISPALLNAVIGEYVRRKDVYRAMEIYHLMHEFEFDDPATESRVTLANVETFELLYKVARHKRPVDAAFDMGVFLWDEMQALGIPMTRLTYDRFLSVCIEASRLDEALRLHQSMRDRGWEPRPGTAKGLAALYDKTRNAHDLGKESES